MGVLLVVLSIAHEYTDFSKFFKYLLKIKCSIKSDSDNFYKFVDINPKLNIFMRKFISFAAILMMIAALPLTAASPENGKLTFNPEPSDNRPFGISVGMSLNQVNTHGYKSSWMMTTLFDEEKKVSPAFQIGFTWSPEFRYGIGIQTGIYYELSTDSYSENGTIMDEKYSSSINLNEHNLSIPVRAQWRYEIIQDLSVFLYTGPSFDISLAYNISISNKIPAFDIDESAKMSLYDESDINRFNLMWGVGGGIRWKFLQFKVGGDWGLTSLYHDEVEKTTLNRPFYFSLSYQF